MPKKKQDPREVQAYKDMSRITAILDREYEKYRAQQESLGVVFDRHGIARPPGWKPPETQAPNSGEAPKHKGE